MIDAVDTGSPVLAIWPDAPMRGQARASQSGGYMALFSVGLIRVSPTM